MKQSLQNLLAEGKTAQVIAQLRQSTSHDTDLHKEVLQISARFARNERERHAGTADNSELGIEQNKINAALLAAIDKLEDNPPLPTNSNTEGGNSAKTIVQNADKIYNIAHIDNANFS
jgi:Effector-associated domain 11